MLNIEVRGMSQLVRNLGSIAKGFNNFRPVFEKISDDFRKTQSAVFRSQGSYEGRSGWVALSPNYRLQKAKIYGGKPILTASGALKTSFTRKGGNHISQISNDRMILGSNDPKAGFHQNGTSKMPARPPLTASNTTNRRWVRIAHKEIMDSIKRGLI
jgi:phage gpG-like protein